MNDPSEGRTCILCNSNDAEFMFRIKLFDIFRCKRCGLYYTDPVLKTQEALQQMYSKRYSTFYTNNRLYFRLRRYILQYRKKGRFKILLNWILTYARNKGKILDNACSTGEFLAIARQHGWETYGVELSQFRSDNARHKFSLSIFTGTVKEALYKDGFFDVVTAFSLFSHLLDPVGDFLEINRILKDDGIFAFMTGNHDLIPMDRIKGIWGDPEEHYRLLNDSSLKVLLKKTGFELIKGISIGIVSPSRLSALHVPHKLIRLYNQFPILSLLFSRPLISHSMLFICKKADLVPQSTNSLSDRKRDILGR